MLAASRHSWSLILAESDDDREWLPNPRQTNVAIGQRVSQQQIDAWMMALDEFDAVALCLPAGIARQVDWMIVDDQLGKIELGALVIKLEVEDPESVQRKRRLHIGGRCSNEAV